MEPIVSAASSDISAYEYHSPQHRNCGTEQTTDSMAQVSPRRRSKSLDTSSLVASPVLSATRRSSLASGHVKSGQQRRLSLSFSDRIEIVTIPRLAFKDDTDSDDEDEDTTKGQCEIVERGDLFYQQYEISLWRCEEQMRKAGMNPDAFDWRSVR